MGETVKNSCYGRVSCMNYILGSAKSNFVGTLARRRGNDHGLCGDCFIKVESRGIYIFPAPSKFNSSTACRYCDREIHDYQQRERSCSTPEEGSKSENPQSFDELISC